VWDSLKFTAEKRRDAEGALRVDSILCESFASLRVSAVNRRASLIFKSTHDLNIK
jgi:hypothetical protein